MKIFQKWSIHFHRFKNRENETRFCSLVTEQKQEVVMVWSQFNIFKQTPLDLADGWTWGGDRGTQSSCTAFFTWLRPNLPPSQPNVSKCTYLGLSIGTTCLRPHTLGAACTTSRQGHRAAGFCAQVSSCRHLPAWTRLSKSDVCPELPGLLPGGSSLMETLMLVISSKSCVKTTLSSCDPDFVRSQRFTFCYTLWKAVAVKSTFSFLSFIFFHYPLIFGLPLAQTCFSSYGKIYFLLEYYLILSLPIILWSILTHDLMAWKIAF